MAYNLHIVAIVLVVVSSVVAQYEDARCKCICPSPAVVNGSQSQRQLYIKKVPPNKCNCDNVILPQVGDDIKGKEQEFCPLCECRFESRNTATIKVVVIIILCIISVLVVYMLFLLCLDPLLNKRSLTAAYQEHTNEEEEDSANAQPLHVRGSVLNRVGHQQDKWKRQVQEQRRNIYVRRTMLN